MIVKSGLMLHLLCFGSSTYCLEVINWSKWFIYKHACKRVELHVGSLVMLSDFPFKNFGQLVLAIQHIFFMILGSKLTIFECTFHWCIDFLDRDVLCHWKWQFNKSYQIWTFENWIVFNKPIVNYFGPTK